MSLLDKVVATLTPEPSPEKKAEARAKARAESGGSGWLAMVIDHHEQIDALFATIASASGQARRDAQRQLALLLTGHSLAEESVLYPAMVMTDHKACSSEAYVEQSGAKVQLAELDEMDPDSKDYAEKLDHLRAAVTMHAYREESDWFPELRREGDAAMQSKLSRRFREEFERYTGAGRSL
jgi:hemerythrin superfamily protein